MSLDFKLEAELKRAAGKFRDNSTREKDPHKKRLMNVIEELVTQREFWARVPRAIDSNKKFDILNEQNQRVLKMLTQNTICPKCGSIDFKYDRRSGMAITERSLKICNRCNTGFN